MRAPLYSDDLGELFAPAAIDDPHALYARLRDRAPVARVGETGVHLVTTWALVEEALTRPEDFSAHITGALVYSEDDGPGVFPFPESGATQVIATADDPEHRVHRALAQPRLAASRVAALEDRIRAWSQAAVDEWIAQGGGDFVPVAEGVPARAVAQVLGLPEADVARHRDWAMVGGDMLAGAITPEALQGVATATEKMVAYLGEHLAAAAAAAPGDGEASMLSALAGGVARGEIEQEQAVGIAIVMFGAGGESTAALIGSVVRRLAEEPALAETLRDEPTKISRFVEELARLEAPFKFHYRVVRRPCALGGCTLAPGDRLMLVWASANRDTAVFDAPDALRLDRRHPKRHLSFGRGVHFCIGAGLARLEARVMVETLLAKTRELALRSGARPRYAPSIFVRRHERLELDLSI